MLTPATAAERLRKKKLISVYLKLWSKKLLNLFNIIFSTIALIWELPARPCAYMEA